MSLTLEFAGTHRSIDEGSTFTIGRSGDLTIDENPYLHRRFLELSCRDGLWWIANVGTQLSATVSDADGRMQAWLGPSARMPLVFAHTMVRFNAGSTVYEIELHSSAAVFTTAEPDTDSRDGETTIGLARLTTDQRLLVVALCEPALRSARGGAASLPTSAQAARRLGWTLTKFNRKLDNVCEKFERAGVQGLHGDLGELASGRRARLVEYALATRLVTVADLERLDAAATDALDG